MMEIQFDKDRLVEFLKQELDIEGKKSAITGLSKIDWNPFNEDGDEHVGVWAEMKNNWSLVWDAILAIVGTLEKIVVEGTTLTAPQKKDAAVSLLDDCLKLPFFLEPFDGIALGMLIDAGVSYMNKVDWGIETPEIAALPSDVYKEIG